VKIDTADWLSDPELARLFDTLEPVGELRFVGGAVRDAVLGIAHSDIDLATTALPGEVLKAGEAAGFRMVPTGMDHGTVTAVLARGPVEITTLRRDVATDGRHAEVAFTDDWQIDAGRRDFTINALSAGRDGAVHDYFGGLDDLAARRVCFIGDAATRIAEDYLRILRFFRFSGRYADRLDQDALAAIAKSLPGVATLSGERILSEVLKLLAGPRAPEMWQAMIDCGLVEMILPNATNVARLKRLVEIQEVFFPTPSPRERSTGEVRRVRVKQSPPHPALSPDGGEGSSADPFLRLMALLPTPVPNVTAITKRLKLSTAQRKRLAWGMLPAERVPFLHSGNWARLLYGSDAQAITDAVMLLAASGDFQKAKLKKFLDFAMTWSPPQFPLGGNNLKELGLKPGPIFGALLRETEQWWIAQAFRPTRQQCFAELKRIWFERKRAGAEKT
jgi:poly(A) polymerase